MDGATQKEKVRLVAALAVVGRKMHRPRKSKTKKSKTQTKKPHDAKRLPQLAASFIYRCDHSMSPVGTKRTCPVRRSMSGHRGKADLDAHPKVCNGPKAGVTTVRHYHCENRAILKARWLMEPTMPLKKEFSDLRLSFEPLTLY